MMGNEQSSRAETGVDSGVASASVRPEPSSVANLVDRLRGIYRIPITDGLGAAGGEEPDNPNEFVRTFQTSPIQHEAADALSAKDRELAEARQIYDDQVTRAENQWKQWEIRATTAERERDEAMAALREKEEESARLTRINTEHCATVNAMNVESAKLEDQLRDVQHRLNIRVRAADDRASAAMAALKEYHDAYSDYRFAPEGSWEKGDASARLEDARDAARSVLSSVQPVSGSREQRGNEEGWP